MNFTQAVGQDSHCLSQEVSIMSKESFSMQTIFFIYFWWDFGWFHMIVCLGSGFVWFGGFVCWFCLGFVAVTAVLSENEIADALVFSLMEWGQQ